MLSSLRISSRRASTPASPYVITRPWSDILSPQLKHVLVDGVRRRFRTFLGEFNRLIDKPLYFLIGRLNVFFIHTHADYRCRVVPCEPVSRRLSVSNAELPRGFDSPCRDPLRDGRHNDKFCTRSKWGRHRGEPVGSLLPRLHGPRLHPGRRPRRPTF